MDQAVEAAIERAAEQASRRVAQEILLSLGLDPTKPIEVQKDMMALREVRELITNPDFQRDMMHLRKWRKAMDGVQSKGLLTMVTVLITGGAAALWVGVQVLLTKN